jgi:excisionase family DNA binding protein
MFAPDNGRQLQWLTPQEAADLCRVTDRTIRNWAASGTLPALKIGRKLWRIDKHALLVYLQTTGGQSAE